MRSKATHLLDNAIVLALGLGCQAVQAQTCVISSGHIALTSGTCAVTPGSVLSATGYSTAVSATNIGTVIDLTPGATVTTTSSAHGIDMINGGAVLLGENTPITVNAASTNGVIGIMITNSVIPGSLGSGIPITMVNTSTGTSVSGYGLRAVQNSSVTLGLDLTSNFSRVTYGVRADTGSTVTLIDSSRLLLTGPDVSPGGAVLMAVGPGSVIDARNGTSISTTGHDVAGIYMLNGGLVRVDTSTAPLILTNVGQLNAGSAGIVADNTVVPAGTIDGATLNFAGIAGTGVTATNGAQVTMSDLTVHGAGMGVVADTASTVNISGSSIAVSDTNGGIIRTISDSGGSFGTTYLRQGAGLFAEGGAIHANGVTVAVSANGVYGVYAGTSVYAPGVAGTLTYSNGTTMTSGTGSHGVIALGSPFVAGSPTVQLQNATITTTGSAAYGLAALTGGTINAAGSVIQAQGTGSYGLFSSTTSASRQNNVSLSGGSLTSAQSTAIQVTGSLLNLSLSNGAQVTGGGGTLSQVSGAGTLNLTANAATLNGAALADATGVSNMTLQNNTLWNLTGSSNVTNLVNDPSAIVFGAPSGDPTLLSSYKALTAVNYSGGGGTISLNTYLGGNDSPSDRLVINGGTATGQTALHIIRTGGPGDATLGNGILVVDTINGGSTSAGAFALSQRVVEGPYEYLLVRTSLDAANAQAWYLRSERPAVVPPPEEPPPLTEVPPAPPTPPAPPAPPVVPPPVPPATPEGLPPEIEVPLYRPEVASYLANQRQAGEMFVHSLHDRLGEPQWIETQGSSSSALSSSAWLRVVGGTTDSTSRDGNFAVDTDSTLIQGGGDIARWDIGGESGRLHLGGMLGYGSARSDTDAAGNPAQARGDIHGWSVGAYGTWYQNDKEKLGWYVDTWATYGWFKNSVEGDTLPEVRYDSHAFNLSGETGYALRIRQGSDWIVEPQAQLIYVDYSEDDITEINGTRVNGSNGNGWISRLGLRTYRNWVTDDGQRLQPYLTLNWWHDNVDNALAFNQVVLKDLYPKDRYEAKAGINLELSHGWSAWTNLGYQWGKQSYRATVVRLGGKYTW